MIHVLQLCHVYISNRITLNKQLIYEVLAATVKTQALAIGSRGSVGESILRL